MTTQAERPLLLAPDPWYMPPEHHPIPPEELPPGWGHADRDDDAVEYRHDQPRVALVAERTEADDCHPALGLARYWELRYRLEIVELTPAGVVGHVSTRSAALEGLRECMHRLHDRLEESPDPLEIEETLESVTLEDVVPSSRANVG